MADTLRVTVARRDGKRFPAARVALDPLDSTAPPSFRKADDAGQVLFPLSTDANFRLTVIHPQAGASTSSSPAWERNDTAFWPISVVCGYSAASHGMVMQRHEPQLTYFSAAEAGPGGLLDLEFRLFRVRRIDGIARKVMTTVGRPYPRVPAGRRPADLPFTYSTVPLLDGNGALDNIAMPHPAVEARDASLFEVAARKDGADKEENPFAPKCVGAWIPREVLRGTTIPPSVLIYFRPQANQDFAGQPSNYPPPVPGTVTRQNFQLNRSDPEPYSKGQYHFDFFFFRTFGFVADPWNPAAFYAMGFPEQIKAAGRRVALIAVVPEPDVPGLTHGHGVEPDFLAELVAEILGLADVEFDPGNEVIAPGIRPAPIAGRIGALAHSNGNDVMSQFISNLRKASDSNLIKQKLREIYLLDPAGGGESAAFDNCASYVERLPRPEEGALRCYTQSGFIKGKFQDLHGAMGRAQPPAGPYDDTSEQLPAGKTLHGLQHRTAAFLPVAAWPRPPKSNVFNVLHSLIPSTMLTHALLLSEFPEL